MVKNYMLELGFSLKETEKILNASPVDKYIKETLYRKVKSYFECLLELGFEKDIIKNIAVKNPHVFCYNMGSLSLKINNLVSLGYSMEDIQNIILTYSRILDFNVDTVNDKILKIKELGYKNYNDVLMMVKKHPRILVLNNERLNKWFNEMILLGYNKEMILEMTRIHPYILELNVDVIREKMEFFENFGYSISETKKIISSFPIVLKCSTDILNDKNLLLANKFNYSKNEIIKIAKYFPQIYWYSIDKIEMRINNLVSLGYSFPVAVKITKSFPQIYSLGINNIKQTIDEMVKLGYSRENVLNMTKSYPSLYSFSIETIKLKIEELKLLGYNLSEIIKMTVDFPGIFGSSIDLLRKKKEFYDSILLGDIFIVDPKMTMQSLELSYARYMYYKSIGIDINMSNYRLLFIGQKKFEDKYKKSREELISIYNYSDIVSSLDKIKKKVVGGIHG